MQQVNRGIISCGNVAERKSGPVPGKFEGSRLITVMRRDADRAKDCAQGHKVPEWYSDADELIGDPDVNSVYIAIPPAAHTNYIMDQIPGKVSYMYI